MHVKTHARGEQMADTRQSQGSATFVYAGTFTRPGGAEGIYVFRLASPDGALEPVQTVGGEHSPTFLALDPQQRHLYAVNRQLEGSDGGGVAAFAVDPPSGRLSLLNRQSSGGVSPPYVSVHPSGRFAFAANYVSGHVASLPIGPDGRLGPPVSVIQHQGRGPNPRRQEGPHAHFITPDPSGRFVLACDLGIDRVLVYRLDPDTGALAPNDLPYAQLSSGAGPRHLAFHPGGRFVFVLNEIDSTLSSFAWDAERGAMQIVDTSSTLPEDFRGQSTCAQVVAHPNGRFVYGSNRGHDSIAIFAVDQETGKLRPAGHQHAGGREPRNFSLDPSGRLLLAGSQHDDRIVAFHVDAETGQLTPTGQVTPCPSPVCIVFRTPG
jgi:6-phosphogluconolactonase